MITIRLMCLVLLLAMATTLVADGGGHQHHHAVDATRLLTPVYSADLTDNRRTIRAAPVTLGQPAVYGQWSEPDEWPVLAVHANLLPNGKVLAWDATPDDFDEDPHTTESYTTRVTLWDPVSNVHQATNNNTDADLFCAGSAHLWDGRVLFAGGDSGRYGTNGPLLNTNIYDPETNTWRQVSNMAAPRWYSSVAALGNGELLTYAGTYFPDPIAEVFQLDETWRTLSSVYETPGLSEDYQWLQTTPEGSVMSFGPQNTLTTIRTAGNGQIIEGPLRDNFEERGYGSYAMYDVGRVLVSGGTEKEGGDRSYQSSVIIDTATGQTSDTSDMIHGRTQHNLTILADGSVLASGGNYDGTRLISLEAGVYQPEIWSPDTGQWREMNAMQINRQYHSIALLLPDGRVLSAGGGYCGTCTELGYEEQNAEIFSPPYLFSDGSNPAIRPLLSSVPAIADYADTITLISDQTARISKAHLIKLGSVTHSQNQDQRLVPLAYTTEVNRISLTMPDSRHVAPPGHYLLFLVNTDGVPSTGQIMKLGQPLLTSGQVVEQLIKRDQTHEFVINASHEDKALKVTLNAANASGQLRVTGEADNDRGTAECAMAATGNTVCIVENTTKTRWKLQYKANNEGSFTLTANLSEESDPSAIPAPVETVPTNEEQTNQTGGNGGGAAGLLLILPGLLALWSSANRNNRARVTN